MKAIIVGDVHAVPEELQDCAALIHHIQEVARTEEINEVWFMGDQHHTHAVVRLEVLHWWRVAFKSLRSQGLKVTCLVGNHDQASPGSSIHAMEAYEGSGVNVIDKPVRRGGILFLPYYHTQDEFVAAVKSFEYLDDNFRPPELVYPRTLICHQTFDGSTYENGFPASDGFDPNLLSQELVISGHIHTGQEYGKVWYVGAPRWRSLSDANVERSIWVVEFNAEGSLIDRRPYSTGAVCRQIRHLDDTPNNPVQLPLDPKHQWRIDIRGPVDWCQARKIELKAAGARIRTFQTQVSHAGRVRESEGIEKAFRTFLGAFEAKHGTPRPVLEDMVKERLSV